MQRDTQEVLYPSKVKVTGQEGEGEHVGAIAMLSGWILESPGSREGLVDRGCGQAPEDWWLRLLELQGISRCGDGRGLGKGTTRDWWVGLSGTWCEVTADWWTTRM